MLLLIMNEINNIILVESQCSIDRIMEIILLQTVCCWVEILHASLVLAS